jgi:hypothetical protein
LYFVQVQVFNRFIARDKKVVGVFVRFRAASGGYESEPRMIHLVTETTSSCRRFGFSGKPAPILPLERRQ